jgi:nitrogen regulatory protein P-II 1
MAQLLIVILDDLKPLPRLLEAWRDVGVSGATILESVGAYRAENWLSRAGLGALSRLFEAEEVRRRTILTAVDDALLDEAIAEADRVVGGFDRPHSGVMFAVPISRMVGARGAADTTAEDVAPPAIQAGWMVHRDTPVETVAATLDLQPSVVKSDASLTDIVQCMLKQPRVHVVCVVSSDNRLVGVLDLPSLADDLFFYVMPEEFLSEVTDLDRVMQFADQSRVRNAADAMQEPVWVKAGETVKDAFKRMHDHRLSGLPVIDDHYHVIGYINLLELLAVCSTGGAESRGDKSHDIAPEGSL